MYIEVMHDSHGNITACYCADTLPQNDGAPLFTVHGGGPSGHEQARLNIDTLMAMEIDAASGQKAIINPATGAPEIKNIDRTDYIIQTFKVDTAQEITPPAGVSIPAGMKVRGLLRR
ncbi:MAG: hypothetical protein HZB84_04555 [Deltaproteobacteria bacterium]|nr:hypothetical protein [Deltaproteobacteria bacterium]